MAMVTAPPPHRTRTREALASHIRTALRLERSSDFLEAVNMLVQDYGQELMVEERDLILSAFAGACIEKKRLLEKVRDIEQEDECAQHFEEIAYFRQLIECEMGSICCKGIQVLEEILVPSCTAAEQRVFLLKMIGDLTWLQVPLVNEDNKQQLCDKIVLSYQNALAASQDMIPSDPLKLSVELNLSLFYHDELGNINRAWLLANQTIARATQSLRFLDTRSASVSKQILALIKENMMYWAMSRTTKDVDEKEVGYQQNLQAQVEDGDQFLADKDEEVQPQNFQVEEGEEHHFQEEEEEVEQGNLQAEEDEEHLFQEEEEPVVQEADYVLPQNDDNVWQTPYSTRAPSPVRRRMVTSAPRLTFEAPPSYGPEDAATDKQIRRRMKSAQARRGAMG